MRTDSSIQQIRFSAISVFDDIIAANRWMDTPNAALGGSTPANCAQTYAGFMQVLGILNAIKTGSVV